MKAKIIGVNPGAEFTELQLYSTDKQVTTDVNPAYAGVAVFKIAASNEYLKSQSGIDNWVGMVGKEINCNLRWKLKNNRHRYYYLTQIQQVATK